MIGPKPRRLLRYGLAIAAMLMAASSQAQSQSWTHPELVDHDQKADDFSLFWESALASDLQGYFKLVAHAKTLWNIRGASQRRSALAGLRTAADTHPEKPQAHFWLGQFLYQDHQWQACADSLALVYAMDPGYTPLNNHLGRGLDESLGNCLLYAGQYEGAIEHFKRVMTLNSSVGRVEKPMGEALMALGRLQEAIEFLRLASSRRGRSRTRFALAVALDRAEHITESRKVLAESRDRDRDLTELRSADRIFAPAEDEHYYLGLAYAVETKRARARKSLALYHFRRYLKLAPDSPWRQRAEQHLNAIGTPPFADDLQIQGSAYWETNKLKEALQKVGGRVRACVAGQPGLLLRIDLSAVAGDSEGAMQVRATTVLATGIDKSVQRNALDCTEAAARTLVAPKLMGATGRHASAHFSLLGAP